MTPGPRRRYGQGVDEIAVVRLVMGDPPDHVTIGEREEAVRRLRRLNLNDRQIATRLGIDRRTVLRVRRRLGLPAVPDSWSTAA